MSKFLLLRVYPFRSRHFNEPYDGIVYSVVISMGFATAENIFYVFDGGMGTAFLCMFTAVPSHAAFAVLMKYYVGLAKFRNHRFVWFFKGLFVATIAHGFYDWILFQDEMPGLQMLALICLALIVTLLFRAMKTHRKMSPFNPLNKVPFTPP